AWALLSAYRSLVQAHQQLKRQSEQQYLALVRSHQDLRDSEERWQLALRGTSDGIWDWHLDTNRVVYSDRWQQMLGYQPGELTQHIEAWTQHIHPDDRVITLAKIQAHLARQTDCYVAEYRARCKGGAYKWVLDRGQALWTASGHPSRMVGSRTDISDRKRIEAQIAHQAQHDSLTSLLNRPALLKRLKGLLAGGTAFAMLLIDLDQFKFINDSLGHGAGDELLRCFAQALRELAGATDSLARLGSDEFVVLRQPFTGLEAVMALAQQIQGRLRTLSDDLHCGTDITASIGITTTKQSCGSPRDVLQDADISMYAAKAHGGNQVVVFETALRDQFFSHLTLELELRQALTRQEFVLHYQPIIDLKTKVVAGFEALVRWQHPQRGLVLPGEFIATAEAKGLIVPLGQWVLEAACAQLLQWQQQYGERLGTACINVNVSARQFYQSDFLGLIDRLLTTYRLRPGQLKLEVTESCMMASTDAAAATLNALSDRGLHLCLDDFGTGYSSLSYLHELPVHSLKIDRSFVRRITEDAKGMAMVRAILALGHSLGLEVTAEGIETPEQQVVLTALGCQLGQGYLFARPGNREAMSGWLATRLAGR
ncbi:MAG TPA: EAL domain-containing protein, partial [Nodosilinea sp.]|nr:EAL domain-containing protein [Nodosilinea sp.]